MAKKSGTKRKPNAAFMRPVTPSATLAEVVGAKAMPRTEVTKKLWAYIKKNGLQDKKNKRMINADANLKAVFGGKSSTRFDYRFAHVRATARVPPPFLFSRYNRGDRHRGG